MITRRGMFETNSSSTHSLIWPKNGLFARDIEFDIIDQTVVLEPQKYGWQWDKTNKFTEKLLYTLLYIKDWVKDEQEQIKFSNIVKTIVENFTFVSRVSIGDEIYPIEEFYKHESSYQDEFDMYIDHQSVECNQLHYLFEDVDKLRDFLINKFSILSLGNDNSYAPKEFLTRPVGGLQN